MSRLLELGMQVRTKDGTSYLIMSEIPGEGDSEALLGSFNIHTGAVILWFEDGKNVLHNPDLNVIEYWGQKENGTLAWLPLTNKLF